MTLMTFSDILAEYPVKALLKRYFLIVIPDSMVQSDRYLECVSRCAFESQVNSRVKYVDVRQTTSNTI
jgi:hypothetical protein